MTRTFDVAIIGAGIAGASLAYFLEQLEAVLVEAEAQPGYHATGRSAAFYAETYGGPAVQPLTTASKGFFHDPPQGFADRLLVTPRGALHIAQKGEEAALAELEESFAAPGVHVERLDRAGVLSRAPMLRPGWSASGLWEPGCADIDVAELHRGFLAGARERGAQQLTNARVLGIARTDGLWSVNTSAGEVRTRWIVNAAGAWADEIAAMAGAQPLGIAPLRRTVAQVAIDPPAPATLPLVLDAAGSFYFKPEAGKLWVSPHDEAPTPACDAQAEELDVAMALDRFERATTARIVKLEHAWAGLRSFAPDRAPVYGADAQVDGFFWCAGQGGFGIQTAPAAGMLAAALLEERVTPAELAGVDAARYAPARFARG